MSFASYIREDQGKRSLYLLKEMDIDGNVGEECGCAFIVEHDEYFTNEQWLVTSSSVLQRNCTRFRAERYHKPFREEVKTLTIFKKDFRKRTNHNGKAIVFVRLDDEQKSKYQIKFGHCINPAEKFKNSPAHVVVFDGKATTDLTFKPNESGTLILSSKKKIDLKRAIGAPIMVEVSLILGHRDQAIGLVEYDENTEELYSVLFPEYTFGDPPVILVPPSSVTKNESNTVTLTCKVEGKPKPTVTWFKDDVKVDIKDSRISSIHPGSSGVSEAKLTIADVSRSDEGSYKCVACNGIGEGATSSSVTSSAASLTVNYPPAILVHPSPVTINESNTVTLTCEVEGGKPNHTVTWFKDDVELDINDSRISSTHPGSSERSEAKLTIEYVSRSDEGIYKCRAYNGIGEDVTSSSARLTVNYPAKVLTSPKDVTTLEGQNVTLECSLEGQPLSTVMWWRDSTQIDTSDNRYQVTSSPISVSNSKSSLTIRSVDRNDEGIYICKAQNDIGTDKSEPASLFVNYPPAILVHPSSITINESNTVTLTCEVEGGKPNHTVTWFKDDVELDINDSRISLTHPGSSERSEAKLTIEYVSRSDEGFYKCRAYNGIGEDVTSSPACLTVNYPAKVLISPKDVTTLEGQNVTLECSLEGQPLSTVMWWRDSTQIDTSDNRYQVTSSPISVSNSKSSLTIRSVDRNDEGIYICKAQNDIGTDKSEPASLFVNYPPAILVHPSSVTTNELNTATLTCEVEGKPKPTVTWFKDDVKVDIKDSRISLTHPGNMGRSEAKLTIKNAMQSDAGSAVYKCQVCNGIGEDVTSSAASLTMNDAELFSQKLKNAVHNKVSSSSLGNFFNLPHLKEMRLEDIFTQMIMYEKSSQSDLRGGKKSIAINNIKDVFVDKRRILFKGNPGVGKSLLSLKLLYDWAKNCLFNQSENADNPVIKFAFLITFRQLNKLDEKMSLSELLKRYSMLDEDVDDSVINYIIEHPELLLILIDGYDEYNKRHEMNDESSFPDKSNSKMPVAALVSKLIKQKILPSSVVMVTSRPEKAEEMKNLHFDRYVEITGFSEEHVIQYVRRYFKSNTEMQTKALITIKDNQDYLRFGKTPLLCLLMCVYIEINISNGSECFPKTLTSFYTEVIKCIEKNYNKEIQKNNLDDKTASLVVEKMKHKMAVLAAELLVRGKYSFNEKVFTILNLSELEPYLKCSSLLFCESSVRKSGLSSEVVHKYSFNHLTFQEYFAACKFVQSNEIPAEIHLSRITLQFMAGLMDPVKHKQLMQQVLQHIYKIKEGWGGRVQRPVLLTCLYEFGDETFVKQLVQENKHNRYWDSSRGGTALDNIDYKVVGWFVDILTLLNNKEQSLSSSSPVPHLLVISSSPLTLLGVEKLFKSLANTSCSITELGLFYCNIDDKCCECLCRYVPNTKITWLDLRHNNITNKSVSCIVECCSQLTYLNLSNNNITNVEQVRVLFTDKNPHLVLHID